MKLTTRINNVMAPTPSAITGTPSSSAPLPESSEQSHHSKALSKLQSLQPIFKGIAHRNHNQHRRSSWWPSFGMLRRNCDKFISALQCAISEEQVNAAKAAKAQKASNKKRRREALAGIEHDESAKGYLVVGEVKNSNEKAVAYAVWMRNVLVPKCYVAFSQLTADNQFATLGVVLISALSQVHAVCRLVAPVPESPGPDYPADGASSVPETAISQDVDKRQTTGTHRSASSLQKPGNAAPISEGKTISRDAVELMRKEKKHNDADLSTTNDDESPIPRPASQPQFNPLPTTSPTKPSTSSSSTGTPTKRVPSTQADTDGTRPTKKAKTASESKGKTTKDVDTKKSKKKKAKKGDDFDDLFKGLV
ncbi:hypothetical protein F5Y18DRAFT_238119 [Xylariaceae sp. FL1019]|nr:hypothetical protein F5Y18DRAFT_238119 [Xylariaceae sp. FL1019]